MRLYSPIITAISASLPRRCAMLTPITYMLLKVLLPTLRLPGYRSAAVSNAFGDRHTIRTATASNAADGRRTMSFQAKSMHHKGAFDVQKGCNAFTLWGNGGSQDVCSPTPRQETCVPPSVPWAGRAAGNCHSRGEQHREFRPQNRSNR